MEDIDCMLEADKTLMEKEAYNAQVEVADDAFKGGCAAMMTLMTRDAHEFDADIGILMPDWELLL